MLLTALSFFFFFFNDTATTEIYTLSLHDALPISRHTVLGQRALDQLLPQPTSFEDLTRIVLLGVIEGGLEVVHHRQEVLEQTLDTEPLHVLLLLQRALLEVVELRGRAQQALVRILQAIGGLARALEGLLQLRLQHGDLLRIGGLAAGIGAALRHPSLVVYCGAGRDLRIVGNQVVSSKRGGNIAQRSAPPRGGRAYSSSVPSRVSPTVRAVNSTRGTTLE